MSAIEHNPTLASEADGDLPPLVEEVESAEMRAAMAFKLADLIVLPAGSISANERSLAADMMLQLLGQVNAEIRLGLAERLARVVECPLALVRRLLLDEAKVAEIMLRGLEGIPSCLLVECAREGSPAHRRAIARRPEISPTVIDALIADGDPEIAKIVLRRDNVTLSPFAVEKLVGGSATDPELQSLLLRRKEIEPAHGFFMFWWVKGERRRRILTRFSLDRTVIQDAFADLYSRVFQSDNPDPIVKDVLVMNDRRHQPRGLNGEKVSADIVRKTVTLAYRNPTQDSIAAISMIAGISNELAGRILRDEDGEPFAVLCKSLSISRDEFFSIIQLNDDKRDGDGGALAESLLSIFDSIARDFSRAIIRYWDWKTNPRIIRISDIVDGAQG